MRFPPARILPAFALLLAAAAAPRVDGYRFTWKVTASSDDAATRNTTPPSMRVTIAGDKLRTEFVDVPQGMSAGSYTLVDAATGTMTMVDPGRKQATVVDVGNTSGVMAMGASLGMKFDIVDLQTTVTDLGAGERLIGRATHRYRIERSYRMTMSVLGRKTATQTRESIETWVTNEFASQRAFEAFGRGFARNTGMLGGNAAQKLMAESEKMPKGLTLKQVVTRTDTPDKGDARTSTTTMEMVDFSSGSFDNALFEVPAGYQVVDLKAQLAEATKASEKAKADCEAKQGAGKCEGVGEINADSIIAAARSGVLSGLKEGVNEGAKESAKDAAKKAIKGLFKKP